MEQSFLAYLRGRCRPLPQVAVGIGDDAAVIDSWPDCSQSVACTDQIIDQVDFDTSQHALADIGFKAMAVNLSDIAAMGATPTAALVTLALPKENATRIAGEIYQGIVQAATEFQVAIAGGDISTYHGPLSISVTLLGKVPAGQAWLRSGAQQGDVILVTGSVGGSILGRHLHPQPRVELVGRLRELASIHAAIDISDGLSLDLDRLCAASGVGAELDMVMIPIDDDAIRLADSTGKTPMDHAWSDGEDFELILTAAAQDAQRICQADLGVPITPIGNIVGRTGLWKRSAGKMQRMSPQGFLH
ncbi:MAG: thiamine-phosphate kinase [Pirellulales bacterium]|nr:thiamine-phosphate kinase [Pirellulales bacterium]